MLEKRLLDEVIADTMTLEKIHDRAKRDKFVARFMESMDVVDDNGTIVGSAPRGLIHRVGLRHRTVFVMIIGASGDLLLQTRSSGAASSPLRLDISVGGHVIAGETDMAESAAREMREELGVSPDLARLVPVAEYNRDSPITTEKPHERNRERRHLFEYTLTSDEFGDLTRNFEGRTAKHEVDNFRWLPVAEVMEALEMGRVADGLGSNFVRWLHAKQLSTT